MMSMPKDFVFSGFGNLTRVKNRHESLDNPTEVAILVVLNIWVSKVGDFRRHQMNCSKSALSTHGHYDLLHGNEAAFAKVYRTLEICGSSVLENERDGVRSGKRVPTVRVC